MMTTLKRFEAGFIVFIAFFYTSVLSIPLGNGLSDQDLTLVIAEVSSNSPVLGLMQQMVLLILVLLVALRWKRILLAAVQVPLCWALPVWAVLSTLWSEVPDVTFRKGLILVAGTLLGVYWAVRFPLAAQLRFLGLGIGLMAILCFGFTLAFPAFGIEQGEHPGAWRGLFVQKNSLARMVALNVITMFWLVLNRERPRWLWWSGLLLAVALLILSTSKTGLVIMLISVLCIPLFWTLRGKPAHVILGWLLGVLSTSCLVLVLVGNAELILVALGRDVTLTGRTGIWEVVLPKIAAHPWLGYGYQGFWRGMAGESADVWYATYFLAPHGHNGYIDLAIDLGLTGLVLFGISCTFTLGRAIAWLRQQPNPVIGVWPLLYLTYLLLYNITESSLLLEPNSLFWPLYVTVATSMKIQRVEPTPVTTLNPYPPLEEPHNA